MARPNHKILEAAANRIARQGRAIGRLEGDDGGVCIMGAISAELHGGDAWRRDPKGEQVADIMVKHGVTGGKEAYQFNDSTGDTGRVVRAMRTAAQQERLAEAEARLADEMRGFWSTPGEDDRELVEVKHDHVRGKNVLGVKTGPF